MFKGVFQNPLPGDPLRFPFATCLVQFGCALICVPLIIHSLIDRKAVDPWGFYTGLFISIYSPLAFLYNVKLWANRVRDHGLEMAQQLADLRGEIEQLKKGGR